MRRVLTLLLVGGILVLVGRGIAGAELATPTPASSPSTSPAATTAPQVQAPGACHGRGTGLMVLPDPACTPGAVDLAVTEQNIDQTICRRGWTATIRPPESYTEELKREQMAAYDDAGSMSGYEEDHLIPLELGGAPSNPENLWPEPGASPNPKDRVEDALNAAVCDGRLRLTVAQHEIATNWIAAGHELGVL